MAIRKQIILNIRRDDVRVALRENDELIQFYIERGDSLSSVGNIIKGEIISRREELNAVFVDIGYGTPGFLSLNDLFYSMPDKKGNEVGTKLLVQVRKEPYGTKGARLTTFIAIPGRYLVLLPLRKTIGISRNIKNRQERKRLRDIAREICPVGMGLIIRTLASGKDVNTLKSDLLELKKIWENIKKKSKTESSPSVLWEDEELPIRITRDLLDDSVSEFVVDSKDAYKKIKEYLTRKNSLLLDRVKLYEKSVPIFSHYGIEQEILSIFRRKVWLKSGGYIVIDRAEALTVFDVNSGKYRGKKDTEEMIYKTNREAAIEIARQLRLRDIGGIIVIDFIDMRDKDNERKLIEKFKSCLSRDKARFRAVSKLSPNGLLEMTRERVRRSVTKRFVEPCPYCQGKGHVLSPPYLFSKFTSWLEREGRALNNARVRIIANPRVAYYFETEGGKTLEHSCSVNNMYIEIVKKEDQPIELVKVLTYKNGEIITEEI